MRSNVSARVSTVFVAGALAACNGSGSAPVVDASLDAGSSGLDAARDASDTGDRGRPTDARGPRPRCVNDGGLPYPMTDGGVEPVGALPDLRFIDEAGAAVSLSSFYRPCEQRPRLLVLRAVAAWSGPSRWWVERTRRILRDHPMGAEIDLVDLLILGQDNLPATRADLAAWRPRYDVPPTRLLADPDYRLRPFFLADRALPLLVLIDPRTMESIRALSAFDPTALDELLDDGFVALRGTARPTRPERPPPIDARFSEDQWAMIRAMSPVPAPPPDPTNRYADDPRAATLGAALFRDTALSSTGRVACATCHQSALAFTDGRTRGIGLSEGDRNTPSVAFSAYQRWLFWDGRADSLWSQAIGPIENPGEMNGSRLATVHHVGQRYATQYTAVFGALPALDDTQRFPAQGRPGEPTWNAMSADDQRAVTRVYVNVGKAIAAFERTLRARPSAFDRYAAGQFDALSVPARNGAHHFVEFGCVQCHHGPLLTDDSFHNVGFPSGRRDGRPDEGRSAGITAWTESPFRADGPFSDAPTSRTFAEVTPGRATLGAFHTPSLRGTARMGPWGHGGTFANLDLVMLHYARRAVRAPEPTSAGEEDFHLNGFHQDPVILGSISEFLRALSPDPVVE